MLRALFFCVSFFLSLSCNYPGCRKTCGKLSPDYESSALIEFSLKPSGSTFFPMEHNKRSSPILNEAGLFESCVGLPFKRTCQAPEKAQ